MTPLRRCIIAALALVVCSGCATIRAHQAETAKYQEMADQITARYRVRHVYIRVQDGTAGVYHCENTTLELGTSGTNPRGLLAHELGHHVLGHCDRGDYQHEVAANGFAVEALQVWGMTQAEAVRDTVQRLLKVARYGGRPEGHNWCAEAADILRRYPTEPDPRPAGDAICQTDIAAVRPTPKAGG